MPSSFHLSKWYLDCVAENGDAFVGYWGRLAWKGIELAYESVLRADQNGVRSRSSIRRDPEPQLGDGRIEWQAPALGATCTWEALAPPAREVLLETPKGKVEWSCVQPKARVSGVVEGVPIEGLGYAERLDLTLAPWKLPIRELHWGRFLGDGEGLVWVDWRGDHNRQLVLRDARPTSGVRVVEDGLRGDDFSLSFADKRTLREGPIGRSDLAVIPRLTSLFSERILGRDERKWRSRGRLERRGAPAVEGWAIHEVVRWP